MSFCFLEDICQGLFVCCFGVFLLIFEIGILEIWFFIYVEFLEYCVDIWVGFCRSEQDWGQFSGLVVFVVVMCLGFEVCEEQGESIGELNEVVYRRGKQKVIELSDEEEDSNRVSIECCVYFEQYSYYGFEGWIRLYGDVGGVIISGVEISSVDVGGRFGGVGCYFLLVEYFRFVEYDDIDGGIVESNVLF